MGANLAYGQNQGSQSLTATPLNGTFGARIDGIDLSRPLLSAELEELKDWLRRHKVLVFEGQTGVEPKELLAFGENFDRPETASHPTHEDLPGVPGIKVLITNAPQHFYDTWHTDGSTRQSTTCKSVLQAVDVPPYGRDTVFADMEMAYDQLSKPLQQFLSGLRAKHSWGIQQPDAPPVEHPVIAEDPVNGRKTLYVNKAYTRYLVGLRRAESDALLNYLFSLVHAPDLQLRVGWKAGTIVMWDNEKTQHYLVQDTAYRRVMHRVMLF